MSFENTISKVQILQSVFPGREIQIICDLSKTSDSDLVVLRSELKKSGICGGRILRVDDVKLKDRNLELDKFFNK